MSKNNKFVLLKKNQEVNPIMKDLKLVKFKFIKKNLK